MTTTEAQLTPTSFDTPPAESATSRFTAVNGATGPAPSNTNGNPHRRRDSEERPQGQPRTTPSGQEKLTITTTTTQREDWQHSNQGDRPQPNAAGAQYQQQSNYSETDSSHKRKRSGSADRQTTQPSSTSSYHSHGLPSKPPDSGLGDSPDTPREASIRPRPYHAIRDPYVDDSQAHYPPYNDETRENGSGGSGGSLWYNQQTPDGRTSADHQSLAHQSSPEDQLREALQRDAQGVDNQGTYTGTSPRDEEDRTVSYQGGYVPERMPLQMNPDHKKRKRNFSNRTKTGCMTCRRRKKKCDETRPECNNCIRGGFVCNGYPTRGPWPKTEQKQVPVPLQSKEGYETGQHQYGPQQSFTPHGPQQPRREPLPGYRGQTLRVDPQHRPLGMEDDSRSASTLQSAMAGSPDNRMSGLSYTQTVPFPTPISASPSSYPDRLSQNDYKRVPPLHDPSRQEPDIGTPQSAQSNMPPHMNMLHPSHNNSPHHLTPQSANVRDTAQMALNHPAASRQRTQKEEMLSGKHYFPFDRELVMERERCNAACWRFNSSTNPNNGVSQEERSRQFRDILMPKEPINISPTIASHVSPTGHVGNNVVVEAPFNCDYGYNIHIGQDVAIGKNCTILDTCEVRIGDRCILGPNVQIFTATLPVDPKRRLGSRGPNLGKSIVIEEDCWIGGGVIILPGRTIRRGSTVGAGSIVTRDVPPYTVVCGNPARVTRGLYPPHE